MYPYYFFYLWMDLYYFCLSLDVSLLLFLSLDGSLLLLPPFKIETGLSVGTSNAGLVSSFLSSSGLLADGLRFGLFNFGVSVGANFTASAVEISISSVTITELLFPVTILEGSFVSTNRDLL